MPNDSPFATCPSCGAAWAVGMTRCWMCGHQVAEEERRILRPKVVKEKRIWSFSLATLMILVTGIAVCLGISTYSPALGVLAGSFGFPTWYFYEGRIKGRKLLGETITPGDRIEDLLYSMAWAVPAAIVIGIVVGVFVAFFAAVWRM